MILESIISEKKKEVENLKKKVSQGYKKNLNNRKVSFYERIKQNSPFSIIAECKKSSPSLGLLRGNYHPTEIAKTYEKLGASAISVLTDKKFFSGSIDDLLQVVNSTNIPVLRKDFIISREQILEAKNYGASAVLLIVRILEKEQFRDLLNYANELQMDCLVEIHNKKELDLALEFPVKIIGINHRDLDTLSMNLQLSFELAPKIKEINKDILVIAESGIEDKKILKDLSKIVDGFLIGTYFMKSESIEKAWMDLLNLHTSDIQ